MTVRSRLRSYLPDRPPTWSEVIVSPVFLIYFLVSGLRDASLAWPVVFLAFVTTLVVLGPVASTPPARRFGQWVREMDLESRATFLIPFFVVLAILFGLLGRFGLLAPPIVGDFLVGSVPALLLYLVAHVIAAGEISRWWTHSGTSE